MSHILILGSRQDSRSLFTSANSDCDSHRPGERLSIFNMFLRSCDDISMPVYAWFLFPSAPLSSPTFSFPLLPPILLFPHSVARGGIGILNVFQVSAQQRISYLRVASWQAAALWGLRRFRPHPHLRPMWSAVCPGWCTGALNGCNLQCGLPVVVIQTEI